MDEECETGYIQSPFSCFMRNNDDEEYESINSLSNFIKAHSSNKRDISQPSKSKLSDDAVTCDDLSSYINQSLGSTTLSSEKSSAHRKTDDSDDCNTLEEYTKSFLNSKGGFSIPNRFRTQSETSDGQTKISNSNLLSVNERLSKVQISNSNKSDGTADQWNIDLSVALQNSKIKQTEPDKSCKSNEVNFEPHVYLAHVQLCNLDISSLASEKLPYSTSIISSFGYVLNRKWPKLPLPKKMKKVGKNWPYNKSKSFKFDSPSPDDIILKKKTKMRTCSFNDA